MRYTTKTYIEKAKNLHKNRYSYPKAVYNGSNSPITITCEIHGDFTINQASEHVNGRAVGCKKCGDGVKHTNKSSKRLYYVWRNIRQRCRNENHPLYEYYGERDINVCDKWYDSYDSFEIYVKDLKDYDKFENDSHTLDRMDNKGDYEEGNVRWASKLEQVVNRRRVKNKTGYTGVTKTKYGFYASVYSNGKANTVGTFTSLRKAVEERNKYITDNNLKNRTQEYIEKL